MRRILGLLLFLACLALACFAESSADDSSQGFTSLFNGKDLTGWKVPEGDNGHWKVVDGVIDYDAQSEARGDKDLWTNRSFTDFVLLADWRIKETPYTHPNGPYRLPDGTQRKDPPTAVM